MSTENDGPPDRLEHNPSGDRWAKYTGTPERDLDADRAVREAIAKEQQGDWLEDGTFRPSTWKSA